MQEPRRIIIEKLIVEIETLVQEKNIDYIDAVVHYCDINNLDIDIVAPLIKSNARLKEKIQVEAEDLNYLPKRSRLPI